LTPEAFVMAVSCASGTDTAEHYGRAGGPDAGGE
jgi:hypothetical protein